IAVASGAAVASADEAGSASAEAPSGTAEARDTDGRKNRDASANAEVQTEGDDPPEDGSSVRSHADKRERDQDAGTGDDVAAALDD
ncbi:hypothetical protein C6A85_60955, partial [Mycobacterium sp. ITM-2017-0098]